MASKSLNVSTMKLELAFLVFISILALPTMARMVAMPDQSLGDNFNLTACTSYISNSTECFVDLLNNALAPHPPCCKAISNLKECAAQFLKNIPSTEFSLIKRVCSRWGVLIS